MLRIPTAVRFVDFVSVFNRLALSDATYLLEWQLLSPQEPHTLNLSSRVRTNILEPFRLAILLYIDMIQREMYSVNIKVLVHRLTEILKTSFRDDLVQELAGISHGDILL